VPFDTVRTYLGPLGRAVRRPGRGAAAPMDEIRMKRRTERKAAFTFAARW
jgi:hypothetical protein